MIIIQVANSGKLRGRIFGQNSARSRVGGDKVVTMNLCIHTIFQAMPEEFPTIQGGGSLILAWQIKSKRVLVVGGGEVARDFNILLSN